MSGLYICFEGPEACGKSTVSKAIYEQLSRKGHEVLLTRHPGATKLGKEIRSLTKHRHDIDIDRYTEQLLMLCDGTAFIHEILKPSLDAKKIVLADRCNLVSGHIYGMANGNSIEDIKQLYAPLIRKWVNIDLLILFKISHAEATKRLANRQEDKECKIEARGNEFLQRVSELYQKMAKPGNELHNMIAERSRNILEIDAEQSVESIVAECMAHISMWTSSA